MEPGWGHVIVVEAISEGEGKKPTQPKVLAGARAAPSADCEGVADYVELLTAMDKPRHQRHREAQEWVYWGYDPEECDLKALNRALDRAQQAHR